MTVQVAINQPFRGARSDAFTMLLTGAARGDLGLCRRAMRMGAHPNDSASALVNPLAVATERQHDQVIQYLLGRGASVRLHDDACLAKAINVGRVDLCELYMRLGAGRHTLQYAVARAIHYSRSPMAVLRFLTARGADGAGLGAEDLRRLMSFAEPGDVGLVQHLHQSAGFEANTAALASAAQHAKNQPLYETFSAMSARQHSGDRMSRRPAGPAP